MSKRGTFLIVLGSLCLAAALCLTGYNIWDEQRAARAAEDGVAALQEMIPDRQESEQLILPEEQPVMATLKWADLDYIGVLEIPALGRVLPVQGTWSDSLLRYSPCLYEGNLHDGMIIAGHNYRSHLAGLSKLSIGDEIRFTDADGNVWHYTVQATQVIDGMDVEAMKEGDWDLTLFTCTFGGQQRFTVRCSMNVGT